MGTILEINNLIISFDGFRALNGVTTKVEKGEIRFFIGPNGAGKTTLLDAICGRIRPQQGSIIFDGDKNIMHYPEHKLVNIGIGRKFQVPSVFTSLSVYENMEVSVVNDRSIMASLFQPITKAQKEKIDDILDLVDLKDYCDKKAADLSHGQKQWLEIAMLLVQDLQLILLDEPVAGMGRKETIKTGELLKSIAHHCTVIVVEHDMEFVRDYASKVTVMHEGRILDEGSVSQVQNNPKVIDVYLGRGGGNCA
ncbi:urea ABC transporter ATP-binding protein UrtD [Pectinatus cerevisiiphilus]|uniref:Urea ABC transporter ATP-binding protein n=1 Tax=Pectinatus cerevisiiphilus TaxID=86956 RepID=A0A4R3K3Q7_9FIRM|nr:urea ABC transporter ATP-binding protein UrtD [Pectinatus cerevisiiphilus]TCS77364.1 urea ABC transporter ATP-binding protein [Pectinatus cerevisiiphilus]